MSHMLIGVFRDYMNIRTGPAENNRHNETLVRVFLGKFKKTFDEISIEIHYPHLTIHARQY